MKTTASLKTVAILLFGSGLSALVYQTAWQKSFRLIFGASSSATAAVLAIFLGGLGVGGALLGRRAEHSTRPLVLYGNLELGVALLAATSPLLTLLIDSLYIGLGGSESLGLIGSTLLRLVLASLVIGPAAVLMGGTLPAAARAVVSDADEARTGLAFLYALNTVGAVVGALVGPLFLFGLLGTQLTLWIAAAINLVVALSARALGRNAAALPVILSAPVRAKTNAAPSASKDVKARLAYALAGLVGFAFLFLELVWYRLLAPILGGSTITFGLILAVALAGIGLGGYLYSRRDPARPSDLRLIARTLALEAFLVAIPLAWGDDLALVTAHLRNLGNLSYFHLVGGWLVITSITVLPGSIVAGFQFPVLFSLLGSGKAGVAGQVGNTYAFNTIGTILGSLLGGLILIPFLGAVVSWKLAALVLGLSAAVCLFLSARHHEPAQGRAFSAALIVGLFALLSFEGPGAVWRHSPIGAGRAPVAQMSKNEVIAWSKERGTLLFETDGLESGVALGYLQGLHFLVNGKSDGAVVGDRGTQTMLGLLPAALHPNPKRAFVIGLGTGVTAGILGKVKSIEKVDVAELEPAILEVAERSALANEDVLQNPKVRVMLGDARELLRASRSEYDLIISEPSNPYRIGIASLFTTEYYEAARARLRPGGMFVQWIQGYEIDAKTLSTAIRTLKSSFPHVSLWGSQGNDLILLGTREPQVIDMDQLNQVVKTQPFAHWLVRAWDAEEAEIFPAHLLAGPTQIEKLGLSVPGTINTDDLNVMEYAFAARIGEMDYSAVTDVIKTLGNQLVPSHIRGTFNPQRISDLKIRAWSDLGPDATTRAKAAAIGCTGQLASAHSMWPEGEAPADAIELWVDGTRAAMTNSTLERARTSAKALRQGGFIAEAELIHSLIQERLSDDRGAVLHLTESLKDLRATALPLCTAVQFALARVQEIARARPQFIPQLLQAVEAGPFAAYHSERVRQAVQFELATQLPDGKTCAAHMGEFRVRPKWDQKLLLERVKCLARSGDPLLEEAKADLLQFDKNESITFSR